ncbi:hypothetical protein DFP72DRAFT_1074979 [Ephemerocybe angulata]|uniref:Uncharacterized protein n=1 Tax=Ephemerocybe angulata TaxID=980116 RepID=A0A8H6HIM8_9AGAR|nr:hypothetical protein DFP72DRAFT_1074979 [Tulosesus angulatus]
MLNTCKFASINLPDTTPVRVDDIPMDQHLQYVYTKTEAIASVLPPFDVHTIPEYRFDMEVETLVQELARIHRTVPSVDRKAFLACVDDILALWDSTPYFNDYLVSYEDIINQISSTCNSDEPLDYFWRDKLDMNIHLQRRITASANARNVVWRLDKMRDMRFRRIVHHLMACYSRDVPENPTPPSVNDHSDVATPYPKCSSTMSDIRDAEFSSSIPTVLAEVDVPNEIRPIFETFLKALAAANYVLLSPHDQRYREGEIIRERLRHFEAVDASIPWTIVHAFGQPIAVVSSSVQPQTEYGPNGPNRDLRPIIAGLLNATYGSGATTPAPPSHTGTDTAAPASAPNSVRTAASDETTGASVPNALPAASLAAAVTPTATPRDCPTPVYGSPGPSYWPQSKQTDMFGERYEEWREHE